MDEHLQADWPPASRTKLSEALSVKAPILRKLLDTCTKRGLLTSQPQDQMLRPLGGFVDRPTSTLVDGVDSYICCATITYNAGTWSDGIRHWEAVEGYVDSAGEGTCLYSWLGGVENEDVLCSFERYKSKDCLWDTHVPSDAIAHNISAQKHIGMASCCGS